MAAQTRFPALPEISRPILHCKGGSHKKLRSQVCQNGVVVVREFGGEMLTRRVVEDLGRTVVICCESEFQRAKKEHRKPDGVGFPVEDVNTKTTD
jgi:hypothetical protein